ncbi:MAG: hypothetical protein ABIJ23_01065 [Candidatus Magasanikbacteria bacterium]
MKKIVLKIKQKLGMRKLSYVILGLFIGLLTTTGFLYVRAAWNTPVSSGEHLTAKMWNDSVGKIDGGWCKHQRTGSKWSDAAYSGCSLEGNATCTNNACSCSLEYTKIYTGALGYGINETWEEYYLCVRF